MKEIDKYILRPYKKGDEKGILSLFEKVFGYKRSMAFWKWKYQENPLGIYAYVALRDKMIVSHCAGIPVKFKLKDKIITAFQLVDFMNHPKYRGGFGRSNTFVVMANRFYAQYCGPDKISFVYGFPGERHRRLGEIMFGYRPVYPVYSLKFEQKSLPSSFLTDFRYSVIESKEIPQEVDQLWEKIKDDFSLSVIRNKSYLIHRYKNHPEVEYRFFALRKRIKKDLVGWVVTRLIDKTIYIMDLGVELSHLSSLKKLFKLFLKKDINNIIAWLPENSPYALFFENEVGFIGKKEEFFLECIPYEDDLTMEEIRKGFFYTLGDYDVY
ncbi:MAG: hypothetical protein DRG20_01020 [Deltaproteobacteria bacterium]|nr:MAG: hypothetical protein DRG20_01020 [Deltaproteobacteria bacterium]